MKKEDDPLWDEPKPTLLGYGFYKLEPIAYLMSNPAKISIISQIGTCVGQLTCDVIAHDDDDNEYDEVPSDPYDLVGQPLNFTVYVKEAVDVPENFCKNIQVEYNCFVDNLTHKTKEIEEKTKNPVFEERFEHRIEYLTKEDIDYLINEKVFLLLYNNFCDFYLKGIESKIFLFCLRFYLKTLYLVVLQNICLRRSRKNW